MHLRKRTNHSIRSVSHQRFAAPSPRTAHTYSSHRQPDRQTDMQSKHTNEHVLVGLLMRLRKCMDAKWRQAINAAQQSPKTGSPLAARHTHKVRGCTAPSYARRARHSHVQAFTVKKVIRSACRVRRHQSRNNWLAQPFRTVPVSQLPGYRYTTQHHPSTRRMHSTCTTNSRTHRTPGRPPSPPCLHCLPLRERKPQQPGGQAACNRHAAHQGDRWSDSWCRAALAGRCCWCGCGGCGAGGAAKCVGDVWCLEYVERVVGCVLVRPVGQAELDGVGCLLGDLDAVPGVVEHAHQSPIRPVRHDIHRIVPCSEADLFSRRRQLHLRLPEGPLVSATILCFGFDGNGGHFPRLAAIDRHLGPDDAVPAARVGVARELQGLADVVRLLVQDVGNRTQQVQRRLAIEGVLPSQPHELRPALDPFVVRCVSGVPGITSSPLGIRIV
mmetsp:Transcript_26055/g.64660  ORF Transcript_26055/g.64660 Transcript_26055/m.64660 type:complete len:441 (-) Transcript_26055:77-1399(-)